MYKTDKEKILPVLICIIGMKIEYFFFLFLISLS